MFKHLQFNYKNDADNLEDFEDTCINTAIDTISAIICSNSDDKRAFRSRSIFIFLLMFAATFET